MNCFYCKKKLIISDTQEYELDDTYDFITYLHCAECKTDVEGGVAKDVQYKNGSFFRKNKQGVRWGVKLRDAVSIITDGEIQNTDLTQTGKNMVLNPQFTEILMGFPLDWTKIEATH